jgi:hypothetical protein
VQDRSAASITAADRWYAASATGGIVSIREGDAGEPGWDGDAGPRTCRRVGSGSLTGGDVGGVLAAMAGPAGDIEEVASTSRDGCRSPATSAAATTATTLALAATLTGPRREP